MAEDEVTRNLNSMDDLDFTAWNGADWHGLFARYHTDDVLVDVHGQPSTHGIADAVVCIETIMFAGTPLDALCECRRILAAGGRLVLTCWEATNPADERLPQWARRL